jgi:hypothetical protein
MTVKIKKRRQSALTPRLAPLRQAGTAKTRRRFVKSSLLATPRRRLVLLLLISSILSTVPTQKRPPFFPSRPRLPPTIAISRNLSQEPAQPAKFDVALLRNAVASAFPEPSGQVATVATKTRGNGEKKTPRPCKKIDAY